MFKLFQATFFLIFICSSTISSAGILLPNTDPEHPLKISHTRFELNIKNQVVSALLKQLFVNQHDKESEATFIQRLPEGAAVSAFSFWSEGKRISSQVKEKKQAEADYETAKRLGSSASLLSQYTRDRFSMKVANLGAHKSRRTELKYEGLLPYKKGIISLSVPLTAPDTLNISVEQFSLTIDIRDTKKITSVKSLSIPVAIKRIDDHHWQVSLTQKSLPKRDLELTYEVRSKNIGLSFLSHRPSGQDGYYMLLASPQELVTSNDIVKKDVVFVFDASGSMQGEKMKQAKDALKRCLYFMNVGDRFGIIAFSDNFNPLSKTLLPLDQKHQKEALTFIDKLNATGGTNIDLALREGLKVLNNSTMKKRPKVIVFLTDGVATVGEQNSDIILSSVHRANPNRSRIFTFGVGDYLNRSFLERLSHKERGAVSFVKEGAELESAVTEFYSKISRPVLSDLNIDFGEVLTAMTYPSVMPDLYHGSQLVLIGRYRKNGKMNVKLSGTLNGKIKSFNFVANFPEENNENAFVARLWARKRISYLLSQMRMHGENDEAKAEIIRLAKAHHLTTRYTSLVAKAPKRIALAPSRIKPGDPEITIRAPKDAKAVSVVFPFGITKKAEYDARHDLWTVRFLIPRDVSDGTYPVVVLVSLKNGKQKIFHVSYTVDTLAPQMKLQVLRQADGSLFFIAKQIISDLELKQSRSYHRLRSSTQRQLFAKTMMDTRSVKLKLKNGTIIPLKQVTPGIWQASTKLNQLLIENDLSVELYAVDVAGNQRHASLKVEIE